MDGLLKAALDYHDEGLNVIPVVYRDKRPALPSWEEYHTRLSTKEEIYQWFEYGPKNIGLVHCQLASGPHYIAIDIDHDNGLVDDLFDKHPYLFKGRIEQSGSKEGYHVPLLIESPPNFGFDEKQKRPRGNRTWKTKGGSANIRARFSQTVVPPSIHPSGNPYRFLQDGPITQVTNLDNLIEWLDKLSPPPNPARALPNAPIRPAQGNDLLSEVKTVWDSVLKVFDHFSIATQQRTEPDGQIRLLGNGGLLLTSDLQQWWCFSDEMGGGAFEAWGYCRFGNSYDKNRHFRQVMLEMAQAAGIDVAKFYKRGDEARTDPDKSNTRYWSEQHKGYWQLAR